MLLSAGNGTLNVRAGSTYPLDPEIRADADHHLPQVFRSRITIFPRRSDPDHHLASRSDPD
jgi:hypothetical protein